MVQAHEHRKKDPYEEIVDILKEYDEGCPPREADQEECSHCYHADS